MAVLAAVLVTVVLFGLVTWRLRLHAARRASQSVQSQRCGGRWRLRWWARHAQSMLRRLKIKLKVFWSFYQIASKVGETYLITYPRSVEQSLEIFSFVNLVTFPNRT